MESETKIVLGFFGLFFVGIIALFAVEIVGVPIENGTGKQTGYVSAVEKSGLFFKTGTAYIKPELSSTQEDKYCVIDDAVYTELETASRGKTRVEVSHYSLVAPGIKNCAGENAIIKSADETK
jgi:hypothetical protein